LVFTAEGAENAEERSFVKKKKRINQEQRTQRKDFVGFRIVLEKEKPSRE